MDLVTFRSVFLSLVWLHAVLAYVAPPTNVTLDCHNMRNVLRWSYEQPSPGLRFRVHIGSLEGNPKDIWVNPPAQLADVSSLTDPKRDYFLDVTAVIGQNESDFAPSEGISFSYFKDSQATKKCNVDFPSVNLTTQHDGTVRVRFTHPSLVYLQKLPSNPNTKARMTKSQLPEFRYDVLIINQHKDRHHTFYCVESVCEEEFPVDAAQKKHCLKMHGELEKILVQATQEYCVLPPEETPTPSYHIALIVIGSLAALLVLGFLLYMVYRKQTTPTSASPVSTMFPHKMIHVFSEVVQDTFSVPEVAPTSPTPLLSEEEEELTTVVPPFTESELRLPLGVSTEDESVSDDLGVGTNAEPGYMRGNELEEDEALNPSELPSGYERRPVFVTLAPDEVAEGYRG